MIDCSKTIYFFKEFRRMCDSQNSCKLCPIGEAGARATKVISISPCDFFVRDDLKEAIELVQQWSDEHPQKTLLEDFKEKYPNYLTSHSRGDVPRICTYDLGYDKEIHCRHSGPVITCKECWNRPLNEVIK